MKNINNFFYAFWIVFFTFGNCKEAISSNISSQSLELYDSNRNRLVPIEIYYPSELDNNISGGNFHVIIFGHGFLMDWMAYENFWTSLVPDGYVLCFPKTEMSFSPNHQDFGDDIKFIAQQMQFLNTDSSSIYFEALSEKTVLMGHSMGGGASFLAAQNNENIHALINFSAAETNPSASSAAENISVPTLLFSGTDDCVTPSNVHQTPIFNALTSQCKTHVTITNGRHCYFAEDNINCNLGELFCGEAEINRNEQHEITLGLVKKYLNYVLFESKKYLQILIESLMTSTEILYESSCEELSYTQISDIDNFKVFPNPTSDIFKITTNEKNIGGTLKIFNVMGEQLIETKITESSFTLDRNQLKNGIYTLYYSIKRKIFTEKLVITEDIK